MDIHNDLVKNYSKCPLKKRPVLMDAEHEDDIIVDDDDDDIVVVEDEMQCEPENLSTKPEDLSRTLGKINSPRLNANTDTNNNNECCKSAEVERSDRIYVPRPKYAVAAKDEPLSLVKENNNPVHPTAKYQTSETSDFKNWNSPLTPPISQQFTHHTDVHDSMHWPLPIPFPHSNEDQLSHHFHQMHHTHQPFHHAPLYHPYVNSIPSIDLRPNFNSNLIKPEIFANPKRFTPYRVDRPLFNMFPLSPASSQASSYNSYESPRRSVSPVSTLSSISENLPSNYSVFQSVPSSNQTTSPTSSSYSTSDHHQTSSKNKSSEKSTTKSAHYQCPDCSKSYSTYSGLSKHLQFHCPAVEGNQAKKNFSCKNCDKVYTSLGALKMHIRTHTLPCKCDICGKAFSRPWLLQGHIRTHTGEKPFNCQHCHRAFADRSNLRAHLQTHSEIKKYSCTTCAKTFSRMSLLTKHMEVGCPGFQINPPSHHSHNRAPTPTNGHYPTMGPPQSTNISVF